jgi:small subunit ribosomal protein S2
MAVASMRQLLESGVHFGHQTRRWNPKMREYIFAERSGIHIIDLQQTVQLLQTAYVYTRDLAAQGRTVLFVGTKKQAQEAVAEEAQRCGMYYVNQRWLGGMLTNFRTIQQRLQRLAELEGRVRSGDILNLPKREAMRAQDEIAKLNKMLGGVKGMTRVPDAVFIVDTRKERLAIQEALRLEIPVIALLDTNCDPDEVQYPIPANDDAIRAVRLLTSKIADAVVEGKHMRESAQADLSDERAPAAPLALRSEVAQDDAAVAPTAPAVPESELLLAPQAMEPEAESAGSASVTPGHQES